MTDPIQFHLNDFTRVLVTNVNIRSELHGTDHVPAADIAFKLTTSNAILDCIVPALREMLYRALTEDDEEQELEGVEAATSILRCEDLEPQRLKKKYEGGTLEFDYGRGCRASARRW